MPTFLKAWSVRQYYQSLLKADNFTIMDLVDRYNSEEFICTNLKTALEIIEGLDIND